MMHYMVIQFYPNIIMNLGQKKPRVKSYLREMNMGVLGELKIATGQKSKNCPYLTDLYWFDSKNTQSRIICTHQQILCSFHFFTVTQLLLIVSMMFCSSDMMGKCQTLLWQPLQCHHQLLKVFWPQQSPQCHHQISKIFPRQQPLLSKPVVTLEWSRRHHDTHYYLHLILLTI